MTMQPKYYRLALSDFRRTFAGKVPCVNSLKKWIRQGALPGERVGSQYYVHVDSHGNLYHKRAEPPTPQENPRFLHLIEGYPPAR